MGRRVNLDVASGLCSYINTLNPTYKRDRTKIMSYEVLEMVYYLLITSFYDSYIDGEECN